ncbi:hypothetical protein HETIRDRAFT_169519 [Heterobasidion irregulare TC 32-1]|uniref:Uncharacterized protein n=1 Tax=Heterobasidion irregulare (strain TC 32-1) TaxID=747525 RepID=W4K4P9_HETIT|nr:uncharacterized protein HETIRDRAFT_169519 [Heterobasidion irregulare TC 32-1]ETW80777.1 hypothetical protein HETIRDRAFT_169519 [Heterobasidion irregulare TC 32-1]
MCIYTRLLTLVSNKRTKGENKKTSDSNMCKRLFQHTHLTNVSQAYFLCEMLVLLICK